MIIFYATLGWTFIFQISILETAKPPVNPSTDWLIHQRHIPIVSSPHDEATISDKKQTSKTLALLFPPGLVGGYRNQVMRFIALVHHAINHDADQLLLPTMLFGTTYKGAMDDRRFFPVPMSSLFDVEHWNSFSEHLPTLVDAVENGDCWEANQNDVRNITLPNGMVSSKTFVSPMANEILQTPAFLRPVYNISHDILTGFLQKNMRKMDLLSRVEHCSRPMVYGGGVKAGRLWNDYLRLLKVDAGDNRTDARALESTELISHVSRALLPKKEWREAAHQCIRNNQRNRSTTQSTSEFDIAPYVALHARVEVDMLIHRCSKNMEKNLSRVFDMVESFTEEREVSFGKEEKFQGIFVAVSRHGMQTQTSDEAIEKQREENWIALNSRGRRKSTIFECGEETMKDWYLSNPTMEFDYFGSVLPSILNFYIATQASVFIGVSKSSWSTDVWTTRYYQGLGSGNFEYTSGGIVAVPNGGLPPPHGNC